MYYDDANVSAMLTPVYTFGSDVTSTPQDGRWHWVLNPLSATKIVKES